MSTKPKWGTVWTKYGAYEVNWDHVTWLTEHWFNDLDFRKKVNTVLKNRAYPIHWTQGNESGVHWVVARQGKTAQGKARKPFDSIALGYQSYTMPGDEKLIKDPNTFCTLFSFYQQVRESAEVTTKPVPMVKNDYVGNLLKIQDLMNKIHKHGYINVLFTTAYKATWDGDWKKEMAKALPFIR